jgi:hypothetical protein
MSMEELNERLKQEKQKDLYLVESARTALVNTGESFRKDLSESAQNFRSDLRDEMKKARESWEKTTEAERQAWERTIEAQRQALDEAQKQLEITKRKMWLRGPLAMMAVVLVTAGLTVLVIWEIVSKSTGEALAGLQENETTKLVELRSQRKEIEAEIQAQKTQIEELQNERTQSESLRKSLHIYKSVDGKPFVRLKPGEAPIQVSSGETYLQVEE